MKASRRAANGPILSSPWSASPFHARCHGVLLRHLSPAHTPHHRTAPLVLPAFPRARSLSRPRPLNITRPASCYTTYRHNAHLPTRPPRDASTSWITPRAARGLLHRQRVIVLICPVTRLRVSTLQRVYHPLSATETEHSCTHPSQSRRDVSPCCKHRAPAPAPPAVCPCVSGLW
ncbi:hypothetical protein BD413DRAFT_112848 [Trametes elegans]|nr:hypothetical protein BD413DRAFT_112848 [Trametes elegans]